MDYPIRTPTWQTILTLIINPNRFAMRLTIKPIIWFIMGLLSPSSSFVRETITITTTTTGFKLSYQCWRGSQDKKKRGNNAKKISNLISREKNLHHKGGVIKKWKKSHHHGEKSSPIKGKTRPSPPAAALVWSNCHGFGFHTYTLDDVANNAWIELVCHFYAV